MTTLRKGDRVQNLIGHWYEIVDGETNPWQPTVQPLTPVGTELRPVGTPVRVFRSDLRIDK